MKIFLFHQFKLKLPFGKEQALNRIFENTEVSSFGKTKSEQKKFIGSLTDRSFKIKKSLNQYYQNSFNPIARGNLEKEGHHCIVKVNLLPSIPVAVFILCWMAYFLNGLWVYYMATSSVSFVYLTFIVFGYLFMYFAFWHEVPSFESLIKKVLEGNELGN